MSEHFKKLYDFMLKSPELASPTEKLIYAIIYSYPAHCFKGRQEYLAKLCAVSSVKTVRAALKALERKGLISIENIGGPYSAFRKYKVERKPEMITYEDYIENEFWISVHDNIDG